MSWRMTITVYFASNYATRGDNLARNNGRVTADGVLFSNHCQWRDDVCLLHLSPFAILMRRILLS